MFAEAIYPILKSLNKSEQIKILEHLKKDLQIIDKPKKEPLLSNINAKNYLIKNFLKKKKPIESIHRS